MDPHRWARIDAALERRLDGRPDDLSDLTPAERKLLDALASAARGDVAGLDVPPAEHEALASGLSAMLAEQDGIEPGSLVGPFRIVKRIGTGGMGVVFLAERTEGGFEQQVALKLLGLTSPDPGAVRLFERERRLLARLEHPGIARLIDGGLTERDRPWFAMEYIDGEPIQDFADSRRLAISGRIELFLQACDALDHAHRQLILHRDIKPANILVTPNGQVRLVDFGLGRLLQSEEGSESAETTIAAGRMTPRYASPEQARGDPVSVTSEVYQLGLLLYQLITGALPYRVEGRSAFEIARAVSDAEIPLPSSRWRGDDASDRALRYHEPAQQLRRRLAGDLDNIVLKALSRQPEHRYANAASLAEDLRRHLERLPVKARAATRRYRLGRFVQRHRAAVFATTAFVLLMAASVVVLGFQTLALERERDRALANAERSERLVGAMGGMIRMADNDQPVDQLYSIGDLLDRYVAYVRESLGTDPEIRARMLGILGEAMHVVDRWETARAVLSEAVHETEQLRGPDSPRTLALKLELARTTGYGGDLDAAVAILDALERTQARVSGPGSEAVADVVYLRGFLRTLQSVRGSARYGAGLSDLRRARSTYRELFAPPHPKIAQATHSLGFKLTDPAAAEAMVGEALAMTRELFGDGHSETVRRMAEFALLVDLHGDPGRAAEINEQAYAVHVDLHGETHPESLTILNNLAAFHREGGSLERAVELYRRSHELRSRTLPEDHLLLAFPAHGLGITLRKIDRYRESERWLREALRLCLLHESRNEAITRQNIAVTLLAAGRTGDAIDEQQRAVDAFAEHFGNDSDAAADARARLDEMKQAPKLPAD